ncbi:TIGR02391 family protein [Kitasatospora sp. NPDC048298]|uniref:TIGR02391 family protein n=1 Tax=Kitasatospora sp. NPDC048298 TaxID=3364049 RepID=UPI003713A098
MDAMRSPQYLKTVSQAVGEFRAALLEFLCLHEVNGHVARGIAPAVFPRNDASPESIAGARAKVAYAAGRALDAVPLTNAYIMVAGAGAIDPIAAWQSMTQPKPVLEPDDVLGMCDQILGRLEALTLKAEIEAPPTVGVEAMHPLVWGSARKLWNDGHFRQAVAAAAEALINQVKTRTGRNDVPETSLWQQVFSNAAPEPGAPRLRWPGDARDRTVSAMNSGLRSFAPGAQMLIRDMAVHGTHEMQAQEALERLAALSLLAHWVDGCDDALAEVPSSY